MAWGNSSYGGDTSGTDKLSSGVEKVYANHNSFAALKSDGSVVTWGGSTGDESLIGDQLDSGVIDIFPSSRLAFAALKNDGSVVVWGTENWGTEISGVADLLQSEWFASTQPRWLMPHQRMMVLL